ncbi:MAG: translation initiation factor IF-2 [Ruminococcaceae bacterium]|nr:translation initiation factor IF-2 [Oscillospiraceae bacterium]
MAGNTTKFKINSLAKDLEIKSKDLLAIAETLGIKGKNPGVLLDTEEFDVLFNALTNDNQIKDINAYLSGEAVIVLEGEEEAKAPAASEGKSAPAAKETPAKTAENTVQTSEKKTEKTDKAAAKEKTEPKPVAEAESKPAVKSEKKPDTNNENKKDQKAKPENKPVSHQNLTPENRREQMLKKFSNVPQQNQQKKQQPKPQKNDRNQGKLDIFARKENVEDTTVKLESMSDKSNKANKGQGVRIIDTRSSSVDLSKYDEKLENFVDTEKDTYSADGKQKFKKQNSRDERGVQGGKEKNNFRQKQNEKNNKKQEPAKKKPLTISIPDEITIAELAQGLKAAPAEIIKRLMMLGVMANVNASIDYDTAALIAEEMGAIVTKEIVLTIEDKLFDNEEDTEDKLQERAPVVCVMGHVDHGKTSLLDAIRHTSVTKGEAGGITQHIGAYRVNINGSDITFLDTPGHEAFTAMRARGAKSTDIAILVVAADDGIMPQTVEAINHAKAANIDIIVAINKMDKPYANPDVVLQGLTQYDLVPEAWGGDTICVPVSALTKMGIDDLLENVLLVAEMKQLKANPNRRAKGLVIEAKLDRGRGPVATVLVQNGTLHTGDIVIAGTAVGRVRAMNDENGKNVKVAGPSVPVEIVGLAEVPLAGDEFNAVADERMARELAEDRKAKAKEEIFKANSKMSLDDLFSRINEGVKELNIIVKADVGGSAEAVKQSLVKLTNEEVKVSVIHSAVGGITEGDVMLAAASNAIIVGFNVRPDKNAIDSAERQSVDIRTYRVIYDCIEEIEAAMKGMLAPTFKEQILGHAEVRQTIRVPSVGTIAGSYVTDGKITRKSQIRILRDSIVIFEDNIQSLRRFKDDVKEVASGYECGIGLEKFNDIKEGDVLEAYEMVEEN